MRNKFMYLGLILIVVCILAILLTFFNGAPKDPMYGILSVNNVHIENLPVIFYDSHIELPLLESLRAIGYNIEQQEQDGFLIFRGDQKYFLDLTAKTFYAEGDNMNYLLPAPGSNNYACRVVDQDLYVDSGTAFIILRQVWPGIELSIHKEQRVVFIKTEDGLPS